MSINRNQIEALRSGYLNRLGSGDYNVLNTKNLPILEKTLAEYGLLFNDAVIANLEKNGSISSGKLAEPSMPSVTKFGTTYTLALGYPSDSVQIKYFDYINKGVKGVKSGTPSDTPYSFKTIYPSRKMAANIFTWLNKARKQVRADNVTYSKDGGESPTQIKRQKLKKILTEAQNKRALAYAISVNIKKKGIKQTKYFDNAIAQVFDKEFISNISYAIISDSIVKIAGNLIKETKENGNNNTK